MFYSYSSSGHFPHVKTFPYRNKLDLMLVSVFHGLQVWLRCNNEIFPICFTLLIVKYIPVFTLMHLLHI